MKISKFAKGFATLALAAAAGASQALTFAPVTVDGATYYFSSTGNDWTLGIDIDGYSGGGTFLDNVAIKVFDHATSASLTSSPSGWSVFDIDSGINANGCSNGSGGFICAKGHTPVTGGNGVGAVDYSFTFHVLGDGNPLENPSIKARYVVRNEKTRQWDKAGAIVSETLQPTPVPEPETYALMLAGLGAVGFAAARRRAR